VRTCERWLCISLGAVSDAPSITGMALASCRQKGNAAISINDDGLQAAESTFAALV
jgi:hypothetical protein